MKKLIKICIVSFIAIILTGCGKNYDKLSFSDYNSYFESKEGYTINDKTSFYDSSIIRYYEAGNGNVQVFFIEYADSKDAKKYVEDLYGNDKKYKIKNNDENTFVKSTKGTYFKLYRVDNIIVTANSAKKDKKELNKVLKDLGY